MARVRSAMGGVAMALVVLAVSGRGRSPSGCRGPPRWKSWPSATPWLRVPRLPDHAAVDGRDPVWNAGFAPARTGALLSDGAPAVPYSDVRLAWDPERLYVGLYAADDDICAADAADEPSEDMFRMTFARGGAQYVVEVSARGIVRATRRLGDRPPEALPTDSIEVSLDVDGTLCDRGDTDEEWLVSTAIPFQILGLQAAPGVGLAFSIVRCDGSMDAGRTCAAWGVGEPPGRLVLAWDQDGRVSP